MEGPDLPSYAPCSRQHLNLVIGAPKVHVEFYPRQHCARMIGNGRSPRAQRLNAVDAIPWMLKPGGTPRPSIADRGRRADHEQERAGDTETRTDRSLSPQRRTEAKRDHCLNTVQYQQRLGGVVTAGMTL